MIRVELRSWSCYDSLFTRLDKYRECIQSSNCKSVSSPYSYRARTIVYLDIYCYFEIKFVQKTKVCIVVFDYLNH